MPGPLTRTRPRRGAAPATVPPATPPATTAAPGQAPPPDPDHQPGTTPTPARHRLAALLDRVLAVAAAYDLDRWWPGGC